MIRFILVISLYLLSLVGFSQTKTPTYKVTATVINAISDKGKVYFALYDTKEHFDNRQPVARAQGLLMDGVSTVSFDNVRPGVYALVCFHDANDNGRMDFQSNGRPLEDYGASNNIENYGPPNFDDAKFEVTNSNLNFTIKF
jgi:uncharacterized protein (DUF2141 family)